MWSYDRAVEDALSLQRGEVNRVRTVLNMQKTDMGASLADYAAWNEMADFIAKPNDDFIRDSIGTHTFESKSLDGIFIFNPDVQLVWGQRYDYETGHEASYDAIRYNFGDILADAMKAPKDFIKPNLSFIVIDNKPFIVATSRVCNSNAVECDKGYLLFLKRISEQFINELVIATGVNVEVMLIKSLNDQPLAAPHRDNISYLEMLDYRNRLTILIKINHTVKVPPFIQWQELSGLAAFSILMFFLNLVVANKVVKPINNANQVLEQFKASGGKMPSERSFISKEMKEFSRTMSQIVWELETSRRELKWQSEHDPLTRIANRRRLEKVFKSYIVDYQFRHIVLFLIDIDYFKLFNDHYGHLEGDEALKSVASSLNTLDFSGEKLVARFGGEEFCVVLASDIEIDGQAYAKRLIESVESLRITHQFSQAKKTLSISVGGVEIDTPQLNHYLDFFHVADRALYAVKAQGRGRYLVQKFTSNLPSVLPVQ
ncbi:diguanylate cyclase [Vibrio anguillarum]|uniref:diguanylate cyclase n=3 Tax=Vibrio anguillarum TaxID=55601 RepID=A0ABR9Z3B5_VIBAN|nr:diguanylate cyclase [Vibrio anguillarum]MBF4372487.1 diguanylate cyclase [Vibrio anguillarum]